MYVTGKAPEPSLHGYTIIVNAYAFAKIIANVLASL